ncbi:hypothetical protein U1Q18_046103 [Sarracenia purpurea var. burkii]
MTSFEKHFIRISYSEFRNILLQEEAAALPKVDSTPKAMVAVSMRGGNSSSRGRGRGRGRGRNCFTCGKEGHISRFCYSRNRKCYECGDPNHMARNCPQKEDTQPPSQFRGGSRGRRGRGGRFLRGRGNFNSNFHPRPYYPRGRRRYRGRSCSSESNEHESQGATDHMVKDPTPLYDREKCDIQISSANSEASANLIVSEKGKIKILLDDLDSNNQLVLETKALLGEKTGESDLDEKILKHTLEKDKEDKEQSKKIRLDENLMTEEVANTGIGEKIDEINKCADITESGKVVENVQNKITETVIDKNASTSVEKLVQLNTTSRELDEITFRGEIDLTAHEMSENDESTKCCKSNNKRSDLRNDLEDKTYEDLMLDDVLFDKENKSIEKDWFANLKRETEEMEGARTDDKNKHAQESDDECDINEESEALFVEILETFKKALREADLNESDKDDENYAHS